eukprot:gnl/TRDRNA2_/TRDRNA2_159542_c0_seq1.p1 gnl/TRDRNA2_/TRDRNA2_159542_c0~~gnl/TRDRNA2_/TRDRNA2_159542_c0_seq1.p1  ORF type:complete len:304 (-),score=38.03 gnl/TRDRNA2_/TRDRNA2_159542_c0_seq1:389-1300(-)
MNAVQMLSATFCVLVGIVVCQDVMVHYDVRAGVRTLQAGSFLIMCLTLRPAKQLEMWKKYGGAMMLGILVVDIVGDYLPIYAFWIGMPVAIASLLRNSQPLIFMLLECASGKWPSLQQFVAGTLMVSGSCLLCWGESPAGIPVTVEIPFASFLGCCGLLLLQMLDQYVLVKLDNRIDEEYGNQLVALCTMSGFPAGQFVHMPESLAWGALPFLPPFVVAVLMLSTMLTMAHNWLAITSGTMKVGPTAAAMCKTAGKTVGTLVLALLQAYWWGKPFAWYHYVCTLIYAAAGLAMVNWNTATKSE